MRNGQVYRLLRIDWRHGMAGCRHKILRLSSRQTGKRPDGYMGWIGPYIYDKNYWQDALVGDAILFASILDFSVLVMEDEKLREKYEDKSIICGDCQRTSSKSGITGVLE